MYKYIIALFLFIFLGLNSFAQNKYETAIISRANLYAKAIKKHDFKSIANLTYPKYVSLISIDTLLSQVSNDMVILKKEGVRYKSIIINKPKQLLATKDLMYCIVPQKIVKFNSQGEFRIENFLFALSDDLGKNWYFINIEQFATHQKELFPFFKEKIIIPKVSSKFVRYKKFNSFEKPN